MHLFRQKGLCRCNYDYKTLTLKWNYPGSSGCTISARELFCNRRSHRDLKCKYNSSYLCWTEVAGDQVEGVRRKLPLSSTTEFGKDPENQSLTNTLTLGLWDPEEKVLPGCVPTHDSQEMWETKSLVLKMLSVWQIVATVIEHYYRELT